MTATEALQQFAALTHDGSLILTGFTAEEAYELASGIVSLSEWTASDWADVSGDDLAVDVWGDCPDICGEFRFLIRG